MSSVTVVVTTLDDGSTVRDCLDGVLGGGASIGEVLVVDRGSSDGTADIVRRVGPPVRLLARPGLRSSEAVAVGVEEARGDVLALVPSRALVAEGAIDACASKAAGNEGGPAAVDLRPVGTTAFGRAAAAIVCSGVPRVEAWSRRGTAAPPTESGAPPTESGTQAVRPSYYLIADTPTRLAAEAFRPQAGLRSAAGAALIVTAAGMALFGRGWLRAALPLGHAALSGARAVRAGRDPGVAPHRAFMAAEVWDWASGAGWLVAGARRLRRTRTR